MDRTSRVRGRPRDPEADTAILRAALELFLEGGVEGASIEQIARRAGVARLTVYRRWASKEALLAQAIEFGRDSFANPAEVLTAFENGTPSRDLLVRHMTAPITDPRFRRLVGRLTSAAINHPELMRAYADNFIQPRREIARRLFALLQEHGELPAELDLDLLLDGLIGVSMFLMLVDPEQRGPAEVSAYLHRYLDQVVTPVRTSNRG